MQWLEALEQYRQQRGIGSRPQITCATVETTPLPSQTSNPCEELNGWWFEERPTARGNVALHLFPSAS